MKSKLLLILVLLVMLASVVSFSGCLGSKDNNSTPDNTTPDNATPDNSTPGNTTPDNTTPDNTTPDNTTPGNTTPNLSNSVTVVTNDGDVSSKYFVRVNNQKYTTNSLNISKGETVRLMNSESRTFRHIFHSQEGAFEDFDLIQRYSAYLTFNQAGTYHIDLLNYYTGEPHGNTSIVLTVNVS